MTTKINKSHLILLKIIEKEGNKNCADCGVEGTRWASWNFGIFLCIRCAGIHRNLGVHISKVKSVDLDSWTSEQLQTMEMIGNKKSQQIYEAALPGNFMRPQSNYAIEEFIRAKYQYKRYCFDKSKSETKSIVVKPTETPVKNSEVIDNKNGIADKTVDVIQESDDSMSDPEYLIDLKEKPKKVCHKVHSDNDLIHFMNSSKSVDDANLMKFDNKNQILSLYAQSSLNGGYQSGSANNPTSCHHKSYGSSVDNSVHSTTTIPANSQNSYLKQIQDKISIIKDNLTSKFKQYESTNASSHQSRTTKLLSSENGNISSNALNENGGHTLSPDLWR